MTLPDGTRLARGRCIVLFSCRGCYFYTQRQCRVCTRRSFFSEDEDPGCPGNTGAIWVEYANTCTDESED